MADIDSMPDHERFYTRRRNGSLEASDFDAETVLADHTVTTRPKARSHSSERKAEKRRVVTPPMVLLEPTKGAAAPKKRTLPPPMPRSEAKWTLALLSIFFIGNLVVYGCHHDGVHPGSIVVSSLSFITLILVLHDCAHSDFTGKTWLDFIIGSALSIGFVTVPFPLYRAVHLRSHIVNEAAAMYPWSDYDLRHHNVVAPLLWVTEDLHLALAGLRDIRHYGLFVLVSSLAILFATVAIIAALAWRGLASYVMFWWILPARVALVAFAAWFGDNLVIFKRNPHNKGSMTEAEAEAYKLKVMGERHIAPASETDHQHRITLPMPPGILPTIAWPTIALAVLGFVVWIVPIYLTRDAPALWTVPVSALAMYILFTPFHDASHAGISFGKHRYINEIVGRCCAVVFYFSPFPGFKWIHLQHHKYTNMYDDPDIWSGQGEGMLLPAKWFTLDLDYLWYWTKRIEDHTRQHLFDNILHIMAIWAGITYLGSLGYWYEIFHYFLIPSRIATGFLAFSFDYVPHNPFEHNRDTNVYRATSVIDGFFKRGDVPIMLLTYGMLFQSFHNIHHLYPYIPFYKYKQVWDLNKDKLTELGTPFMTYIPNIRAAPKTAMSSAPAKANGRRKSVAASSSGTHS